jgi:formylglycine-generating enzyme required for sulfatase activity
VAVAPPLAVAPFDAAEAKAHQQAWSKYLGVPVEYTNSIGMKFMLIPPGEFMMGAPETDTDADDNEKPQVPVRISRPFYLGKYEVTNREFRELFPEHKSAFDGAELPVSMVNHVDCTMYCFRLRHRDMKQYRLPTEAEWECACRAGTTTRFSFGDSMQELNNHSWNESNSGMKSHTVGQKSPNAWGMFDMHGNVWEMCHDGGRHNYMELSALERIQDPIASLGSERPNKGGGFGRWPTTYLRSSMRGKMGMDGGARINIVGFRLLLEIPNTDSPSDNPHTTVAKSLPPNLEQGLIAYYPFNGNANDESGNGHHGTTVGGATYVADRHGNSNQAFSSTSDISYIIVPDHNDLDLGNAPGKEMTISLWFKGLAENGRIGSGRFVNKQGKSGRIASLMCDYRLQNDVTRYGIYWGTGASSTAGGDDKNSWMMTGVIPSADLWHHLLANYDRNDGGGKGVFLDGVLIQQGGIGKKNAANDQPLHIGPWHGSLDDIRIYNRALSAAEVKALYEFEKP